MYWLGTDFGDSWARPVALAGYLGAWDGVAPGPGVGLLLREPPHAGRIFMAGHHDVPSRAQVPFQ
jgi:hypothetical protein